MITSPDNYSLKLIRKLRLRKHRDREEMLVAEGEDLVAMAAAGDGVGGATHLVLSVAGRPSECRAKTEPGEDAGSVACHRHASDRGR